MQNGVSNSENSYPILDNVKHKITARLTNYMPTYSPQRITGLES